MLAEAGLRPEAEAAYSAFEHLWRSVSLTPTSVVAVFTVYLDESYGPVDAYSVAGYVGTVEEWIKFERDWKGMLKTEQVDYLHKRELEHCEGQFKKWKTLSKEEQAANKLRVNKQASGIIRRRASAGFGFSVIKSEWDRVDKGMWASWYGENFYAAGALNCMRTIVSKWAVEFNHEEPIRYIFERGAEGAHEVDRMLRIFDRYDSLRFAYRLGGWSFERKKDEVIKGVSYPGVIQLQAADFLAYEVYRDMEHRIIGDQSRPRRGAFLSLIKDKGTPHYLRYIREAGLRTTIARSNEQFEGWNLSAAEIPYLKDV